MVTVQLPKVVSNDVMILTKLRCLEVALMGYRESVEYWRVKNLEEIARKVAVHRKRLQSEYGLSSNDDVSSNTHGVSRGRNGANALTSEQESTQRYGKVTSEKEPQLHVSIDVPPAECGMRISNVSASILVQSHRSHQCQPSARQALPNSSLWQPFTVWSFQPSIGMPVGTIGTGESIQNAATILNGNDSIQASPMPLSDLFQMKMGRIQQAKEQAIQIHEDKKSRLKAEYEKERDEICKKYDMLLQHYEMVLAQKEKDFETHYKKIVRE